MKRCSISFETLADYHDGRADENAAQQVRDHLASGCTECRNGLAWLGKAAHTIRDAESVQVPSPLIDRLQNIYAERFRMPARPSLLARLSFDSRANHALAGARGAGEEAFKLNYTTDLHDIDVWQEPAGQTNWYLIGQVLPREGDETVQPQQVILTSESGSEYSVTPEMPEFHLPSVPAGVYRATLRLQDGEIVIPAFTVGQGER